MERYHGGTMQGGPRLKVISVYFGQTPAVEEAGGRVMERCHGGYARRPRLKVVGVCFGQTY
jgi:hypothetical protein